MLRTFVLFPPLLSFVPGTKTIRNGLHSKLQSWKDDNTLSHGCQGMIPRGNPFFLIEGSGNTHIKFKIYTEPHFTNVQNNNIHIHIHMYLHIALISNITGQMSDQRGPQLPRQAAKCQNKSPYIFMKGVC